MVSHIKQTVKYPSILRGFPTLLICRKKKRIVGCFLIEHFVEKRMSNEEMSILRTGKLVSYSDMIGALRTIVSVRGGGRPELVKIARDKRGFLPYDSIQLREASRHRVATSNTLNNGAILTILTSVTEEDGFCFQNPLATSDRHYEDVAREFCLLFREAGHSTQPRLSLVRRA